MQQNLIKTLFALLLFPAVTTAQESTWTTIDDVNPFIGTGGHGHTHVSAQAPFGMIQLGPNTRYEGWDGCGGYHYSDNTLLGFSATHLSGTGVSDYGDLLLMPNVDKPTWQPNAGTPFNKATERAEVGYYYAALESGIAVEVTAAERSGLMKVSFPENTATPGLLVDLQHRDRVLNASFAKNEDSLWTGSRISSAWASEQHFYYALHFSTDPIKVDTLSEHVYYLTFESGLRELQIHVAMSGVDKQGAVKNLRQEHKDIYSAYGAFGFDQIRDYTRSLWRAELGKSRVKSSDAEQRAIFATSLYHAYSVPNLWSDVDGRYRGRDNAIHTDTTRAHYTIFSLWDTYRTAHPLYTITQPERTQDFLYNFLDQFEQGGRLPIWELAANETDCMIGYHSVSVIADALAKGYHTDTARTLKALKVTAELPLFGLEDYMKYGYLSIEDESESVSKTLEYAYDDATISWAAQRLGDQEMAAEFNNRATAYRSLVDPATGLARPRSNGGFLTPYEPREVNNHFTEANAYQYSFSPVHDIEGWTGLLEANNHYLYDLLEELFNASAQTTGRNQADITGLIGQYAHGNEPSHHIAYLYNATSNHHMTSERVHDILERFYQNAPDGLHGNEDCGQMSAWYVMASMGLYPLVPGIPEYQLSTPIWDEIELQLPNGNRLNITTSGEGTYIRHMFTRWQDGTTRFQRRYVTHEQLLEGGAWQVVRTDQPGEWATEMPYSTSLNNPMAPAPVVTVPVSFSKATPVDISTDNGANIAGMETTGIENGKAVGTGQIDMPANAQGHGVHVAFYKKVGNRTAEWTAGIPHVQYAANGSESMVDGISGDVDWRKGHWTGFQGQDATLVVDLKRGERLQTIKVGLLKDIKAWIALPNSVTVEVRYKGSKEWTALGSADLEDQARVESSPNVYGLGFAVPSNKKVVEIRITYTNAGVMPDWHEGRGHPTYFFTDEITLVTKPN